MFFADGRTRARARSVLCDRERKSALKNVNVFNDWRRVLTGTANTGIDEASRVVLKYILHSMGVKNIIQYNIRDANVKYNNVKFKTIFNCLIKVKFNIYIYVFEWETHVNLNQALNNAKLDCCEEKTRIQCHNTDVSLALRGETDNFIVALFASTSTCAAKELKRDCRSM